MLVWCSGGRVRNWNLQIPVISQARTILFYIFLGCAWLGSGQTIPGTGFPVTFLEAFPSKIFIPPCSSYSVSQTVLATNNQWTVKSDVVLQGGRSGPVRWSTVMTAGMQFTKKQSPLLVTNLTFLIYFVSLLLVWSD
jgi:hypothetical protein